MNDNLISNIEFKIKFAQVIVGLSKEIIESEHMPFFERSSVSVVGIEMIEIRFEDSTLSCYFSKDTHVCKECFLFIDNDRDVNRYKKFCDDNYTSYSNNFWVNVENKVNIQIINDENLGEYICFKEMKLDVN